MKIIFDLLLILGMYVGSDRKKLLKKIFALKKVEEISMVWFKPIVHF